MKARPSTPWGKRRRIIAAITGFAGAGLIAEHLLTYGWTMHWAPVDHGVAGLVLIIVAVLLGAAPCGK